MDVGIFFDKDDSQFKLLIDQGDLVADEGLETAVLISVFSDQRVSDAELPQGLTSKRGYWGDMYPEVNGDQLGSKVWTFDRSKLTDDVIAQIEIAAKNSLDWMIEDKVAKTVSVTASVDEAKRLILVVEITKPDGKNNKFGFIWDKQALTKTVA